MIPLFAALASILLITAAVYGFNRYSPFKICPICAGVSVTWLWMLAGLFFGYLAHPGWLIIAITGMGGSIVGIAYQVSKRLPANRSPLLWQTLFIPAGFAAVYSFIYFQWIWLGGFLILIGGLSWHFLRSPKKNTSPAGIEKIEKLEKEMEDCC